jgi:hypothetical protein
MRMPTKITELFDVDVQTVGLVKRGANKKRWFLMKSQEGNMADEKDVLKALNEIEQVEDGAWEDKHVRTLASILKGAVSWIAGKEQEADQETEPEPPDESDLEARMDELEKAHKTQLEQAAVELQKAQEEVAEARREAKEALEKADAMAEAKRKAELEPIAKAAGMEVDLLYFLEKASPDAFEAMVKAFKAKDAQLEELGFWEEKGSSQTGKQKTDERILERATALQKDGLSHGDAILAATMEVGGYDEYREQLGRQRI